MPSEITKRALAAEADLVTRARWHDEDAVRTIISQNNRRLFRLARNHHFCRLDDRQGVVASTKLQLIQRVAGDDRRQRLVPNPEPDLSEQAVTVNYHTQDCGCGADLTYPGWDATLDLVKQWVEAVGEILRTEVRLDCDHSASDVDADGGWDDRVPGRDDRADGCSDAEVGVGHERDVPVDDREPSRAARLRERLLVELGGPRQQLWRDLDRRHSCIVASPQCAEDENGLLISSPGR